MKTNRSAAQCKDGRSGFTLIEIMIVVSIIALVAAMGAPSLIQARQNAQRTRLLEQLKTHADAFSMYSADNQHLPLESNTVSAAISQANVVPTGMNSYMPGNSDWTKGQEGTWYWVYYPGAIPGYKGFIWLYNPNLTTDDITFLDQKLDDGNPNTGALLNYGGTGLLYAVE